jgi:hypothetical protein
MIFFKTRAQQDAPTQDQVIMVLNIILTSNIPFKSRTLQTNSATLKTTMMMLVISIAEGKKHKIGL